MRCVPRAGVDRFGNGVVAHRQEAKLARGVGPAQQHVVAQVPDREQLVVEPRQLLAGLRPQIQSSAIRGKFVEPSATSHGASLRSSRMLADIALEGKARKPRLANRRSWSRTAFLWNA